MHMARNGVAVPKVRICEMGPPSTPHTNTEITKEAPIGSNEMPNILLSCQVPSGTQQNLRGHGSADTEIRP